jgi:5-hydroxyisourate hydrolase
MTEITTHVLDTATGQPAAGVAVALHARGTDGGWTELGAAATDGDGRARGLAGAGGATAGVHRLVFDTAAYHEAPFFPEVIVTFEVGFEAHLHVPLLLSPFGYSVYRGS